MMTYLVAKDLGTFSAAHQLPYHNGKCRNLHGHNYRVVVQVEGNHLGVNSPRPQDPMRGPYPSSYGMLIDFGDIKRIYKEEIEQYLDHALILGTHPLPWYDHFLKDVETETVYPESNGGIVSLQRTKLGRVVTLPVHVTTAELMSEWMAGIMFREVQKSQPSINYLRLELWETDTSCGIAEVYR